MPAGKSHIGGHDELPPRFLKKAVAPFQVQRHSSPGKGVKT